MATPTKTSTYVYFGGGLHAAKDNADASRQFTAWISHNGYGASDLGVKDGRLYVDGGLKGHISYNGRVWDMYGDEIVRDGQPNAQQHLEDSKSITSSLKLAVDELDDKGVIASFTKLIMARMMEGDDVTEQLHALNYLRQQAGLKLITLPPGAAAVDPKQKQGPKSAPKQEERAPHREPEQGKAGPMMSLALNIPFEYSPLPDNDEWTNRFDIRSESSNRLYRIAQNKKKRFWGCNCPGWISRKKCKHLTAMGLPGEYTPYEPKLKSGSKKQAGKFKLYTGPTIVKQTADALRQAGVNVTVEGTEHVHFLAEGDRDSVSMNIKKILGPQWGVDRSVQQISSKQGADMIHSDNDLGLKLEPASPKNEQPKVSGPEAGPSNDEMYANGHSENGEGGSPMYDGNLKSPERQNVNAIREALDTQVEMEVGKPIAQKQQEVEMAEKVQDAALAQGAGAITGPGAAGSGVVEAKPGTQIIINVASKKKALGPDLLQEVESECPECDHPLPHSVPYGCEVERGDHPGGEGDHGPYGAYAMGPCGCMYGVQQAQVKRSAEPIGGEPEMQSGITSGHAGGAFGGTDLEGPSFHVGFTFKGYHREASFTSLAEADKFLNTASKKFGKLAGDWTMKCPHCGKTASKDKPTDNYKCACGWDSGQAKSAEWATEALPYQCFVLDENGDTESATNASTPAEAMKFFTGMGINPSELKSLDKGDKTVYTYMRTAESKTAEVDPSQKALVLEWLKTNNLTTGEIEKRLGGGKYSVKAYPILVELAKEGLVKHKQMRWYLKTGSSKVADGWTNMETETVNLYITNDRPSHKAWWDTAKNAVEKGIPVEQVAKLFSQMFSDKQEQMEREMTSEYETPEPVEQTNWLEIAQDAMDYVRNEGRAEEINLERNEGPAEQRFKNKIEPGDDLHARGMGISLSSLRKATIRLKVGGGIPQKGTPEWHQVQIAIKTLKMPGPMQGVMGQSAEQAQQVLAQYGLKWDGAKVVKTAGDGMAKTEKELEKEAGFNFFFPGQVLKEFYPEIQHEIVDYPNSSNQSMSMENPEIVGDNQGEIDGLVDNALDTTIVEMIQLPADVEGPFSMAASKRAADYSSTSPAGGMGIGRDGKPEVLEGAPLRKENDIRGYMFTDEFYGQYEGIPGAAMNVASKTAAAGGEVKQFSEFLNIVCGEIAATMVAAFKVTSRPLLDKIPGVGEIQLDQIEQGVGAMLPPGQITQGGRVQFLLEQLNDSEIKSAINEAWAQSAVWHDGANGGFVYEVFVRPETIDTDSLKMKYKFVCGTKQ